MSDRQRLKSVWQGMHSRCSRPGKQWHRYGGRGITVCHAWTEFSVFATWALSNGYQQGLQLDRRDNDGNYEPANCRFVTPLTNVRNSSVPTLTESDVAIIKSRLRRGQNLVSLAKVFGVCVATVKAIRLGYIWKDVEPMGDTEAGPVPEKDMACWARCWGRGKNPRYYHPTTAIGVALEKT